MRFCSYHKRGCILGDEMGLGKTIQTLVFLETTKKAMGDRATAGGQAAAAAAIAVDETVILLHPLLHLLGASILQ